MDNESKKFLLHSLFAMLAIVVIVGVVGNSVGQDDIAAARYKSYRSELSSETQACLYGCKGMIQRGSQDINGQVTQCWNDCLCEYEGQCSLSSVPMKTDMSGQARTMTYAQKAVHCDTYCKPFKEDPWHFDMDFAEGEAAYDDCWDSCMSTLMRN